MARSPLQSGLTPAERRHAIKNLLDQAVERTFARGPFAATILSTEIVQAPKFSFDGLPTGETTPALKVGFKIRHNGNVVLCDDWVIFDPRAMVPDGEEANPDYDPEDPFSPQMRGKYRQDFREAFRTAFADMVETVLARRQAR